MLVRIWGTALAGWIGVLVLANVYAIASPGEPPSAAVAQAPTTAAGGSDARGTGQPGSADPDRVPLTRADARPTVSTPAAAVVVTGAAESGSVALGSAFAKRGSNACSWVLGAPGIEKTLTFRAGTFRLTSFKNLLVKPAREYVATATSSPEFRFGWDGQILTGDSLGWACKSGAARKADVGGEPVIRVDLVLARATVQVSRHYVIFPRVALIREWSTFRNIDTREHEFAQPSFLYQRLMGDHLADTDVLTMDGDYEMHTYPAASVGDVDARMPWLAFWNRARHDGMYAGYDHYGPRRVQTGTIDDKQLGLLLDIDNIDTSLPPKDVVRAPMAFTATYRNELDDMTNRLLQWQYRYLWDYTRQEYFPAVADEGNWKNGSSWGDSWDGPSTLQKVFNQVDHMRYIGADLMHRDNGWWANIGDWSGADWRMAQDYLGKSNMQKIIYFMAFNAEPDSKVYQAHPEWFSQETCGYGGDLVDLSIPAARKWFQHLLISKAKQWGDYSWRHDSCPLPGRGGPLGMLRQEQAFRQVLKNFLTARPHSGYHLCSTGPGMHNYDMLHFAESGSFTDPGGLPKHDGASRIWPTDKLSPVPEGWEDPAGTTSIAECGPSMNIQLIWNPDLYGDTASTAALECTRKVIDMYHYLAAQGVVGRWVRQYHPQATDLDRNWFERLSGDRKRGLVSYTALTSDGPITVYPKGLIRGHTYDVRFGFDPTVQHRTGQDLMDNGITLPSFALGEMIFLGMPKHPGAGTDHLAPTAPTKVTTNLGTNMGYRGVEVHWQPAQDDNWVSYYEVLRNGKVLDKVGKGTFYFDHTPQATLNARYAVRAVDGDENRSDATGVQPDLSAVTVSVDDTSSALQYTGLWEHATGLDGPAKGSLSSASGHVCRTACQAFGDTQGLDGWSVQDGPPPMCGQSCQQFGDTQGQNNWRYQNGPGPVPAPCGTSCLEFSSTQGANGWSYQKTVNGDWVDISTYREDFQVFGECCVWTDLDFSTPDDFSGFVTPRYMTAGVGHDTARTWTAPHDGVIDISGQILPALNGHGTTLTITHNDATLWTASPEAGSTDPIGYNLPGIAVAAGDTIRFQMTAMGALADAFYASEAWSPNLAYQGDPVPPPPDPPTWEDIQTYHDADWASSGPYWHDLDTAGYVSARRLQPGSDRDVARVWVAPQDGTVDISGHVAKTAAGNLGIGGDGVDITITRNDTVLWGPTHLAGDDTVGLDTELNDVSVAAGDLIRFQVSRGEANDAWNDVVDWDLQVLYPGESPPPPLPDVWSDIATYHNGDFSGDGPYWQGGGGTVSAHLLQATLDRDVARTWVAPHDGVIDIGGTVGIAPTDNPVDGATVSITKNGQLIWGPENLDGNQFVDAYGLDASVGHLPVDAGDIIRFEVSTRDGAYSTGIVAWDPDLSYAGAPPTVIADSVSWTFTGSQITWYTRLGRDHGLAEVLIDGVPDGTFDTWAADNINYAIPLYNRTFPTVGQHTITVRALGERNPKAANVSGTIVSLDGFEADTSAPKVVENTNRAIAYHGAGWQRVASATASGGSWHATSAPDAWVSYSFRGRSVTWVGRVCSACGAADVYLDGHYAGRVDTYGYRGPNYPQAALFEHTWKTAGSHTIRLVMAPANYSSAGTKINVDAFQVG